MSFSLVSCTASERLCSTVGACHGFGDNDSFYSRNLSLAAGPSPSELVDCCFFFDLPVESITRLVCEIYLYLCNAVSPLELAFSVDDIMSQVEIPVLNTTCCRPLDVFQADPSLPLGLTFGACSVTQFFFSGGGG